MLKIVQTPLAGEITRAVEVSLQDIMPYSYLLLQVCSAHRIAVGCEGLAPLHQGQCKQGSGTGWRRDHRCVVDILRHVGQE